MLLWCGFPTGKVQHIVLVLYMKTVQVSYVCTVELESYQTNTNSILHNCVIKGTRTTRKELIFCREFFQYCGIHFIDGSRIFLDVKIIEFRHGSGVGESFGLSIIDRSIVDRANVDDTVISVTILNGTFIAVTLVKVLDLHVTIVEITVFDQTFFDVFLVVIARADYVRVRVVFPGTTTGMTVFHRRGVSIDIGCCLVGPLFLSSTFETDAVLLVTDSTARVTPSFSPVTTGRGRRVFRLLALLSVSAGTDAGPSVITSCWRSWSGVPLSLFRWASSCPASFSTGFTTDLSPAVCALVSAVLVVDLTVGRDRNIDDVDHRWCFDVDYGVVDGTFVEVEIFDFVEIDGGVVIDDYRGLSITAATVTVFREVFVFDRGWCAVDLTQFLVVLHYGGHRIVHFGRVVGLRNGLVLVNVFVVFLRVLGEHIGDFGDGRAH
ncbi:hypothetical protein AGLY_013790 [Aphis glycines]|uniref:Uncharacterized protein n=1 Tax=Aphis glycines TaxID=307491 RepID=A0A6G0T771_APHGL|nr:hypothetical protein AGLY_013790 [Aphis glycines]